MVKDEFRFAFVLVVVVGGLIVWSMVPSSKNQSSKSSHWHRNFVEASQQAEEEDKFMLLDFTGSDWCGWCIRLEREVFTQVEFQQYAQQNLVCVTLDFPRQKQLPLEERTQNRKLQREYDVKGFPTIIVLSPSGKYVGKTGYRRGGAVEYVEHLKEMIQQYDET